MENCGNRQLSMCLSFLGGTKMDSKTGILDCNRFTLKYADKLDPVTKDLVVRREKVLGSSYRLFYRKPLNLVKGEGV